ncbi:peptidase S24 [Flavobacteriaceae bacterium Ap0902]|nr:peptidase S24 [Flavobacteriaceae bacterium Ap0902]
MSYGNFKGKSKNTPLNSNAIEDILTMCPDINPEWLLTGNGEMLKSDQVNLIQKGRKTKDAVLEQQEVPLYDFEATAGLNELFKNSKQLHLMSTIKIPNIPACDGAIAITGDSMYPLLKSGDIIMYKQIPVETPSIFFGEMYLLGVMVDEFEEMVTVKYVQKSDLGSDYVKLVSQNQHHQPKDIKLDRITAMAMVKVSIRKNTMF